MDETVQERLEREQLELAPVKKRAVATLIDELLLSFLLIIILWDSFQSAQTIEDMIMLTNAFVFEFMAMKIAYQTFFIVQYGATVGKIAMKIQVIELSTMTTPTIFAALNRAVFRIISEMIFYLGFIWGMMDPARQTWHDKTARTVVVDV
ncbi:MAG: RDD family protein [Campylobacterota bacterium]|nr:RDD family protein [Campylobacterota bacterium]